MIIAAGFAGAAGAVLGAGTGVTRVEVSANDHAVGFYESVGFIAVDIVETLFGPTPRLPLHLL